MNKVFIAQNLPAGLFYIFLALSFFATTTSQLAMIGLSYIFVYLTSFLLRRKIATTNIYYFHQPELLLLLLYCFYIILSLFWGTISSDVFLSKELTRIAVVLALILAFSVLSYKQLLDVDRVFIVAYTLAAMPIIISFDFGKISDFETIRKSITRDGIFYHHSPFGWISAICSFLSLRRLHLSRSAIYLLPLLLGLIFLFLCQSRGAYLLLVVCILVYSILQGHFNKWLLLSIASVVFTFIFVYLIFDFQPIDSLIDRGGSFRDLIYSNRISAILENPILGHGYFVDPTFKVEGRYTIIMHAHSLYLSTLFYGGLLGLLIVAAFLLTFFSRSWSITELLHWYSLAIAGAAVFLFDGNHFITYPSGELYLLLFPILLILAAKSQMLSVGDPNVNSI